MSPVCMCVHVCMRKTLCVQGIRVCADACVQLYKGMWRPKDNTSGVVLQGRSTFLFLVFIFRQVFSLA